jgi:hypothetical protein
MRIKAVPVSRLVVAAPDGFGKRARSSFANVIGIPGATLKELRQAGNEIALILRGPQGETVGGDQVALPLAKGRRGSYWLSAKIVLEPFRNEYALKSISLSVFKGEPRSEKEPVVRAEWDCPISVVNTHAQPHWHAYPEISTSPASEAVTLETFQPEQTIFELPDEEERTPPDMTGFTKIHLAMASTWHLTKNPQDRVFMVDEAQVFAWIENCTKYLRDQFTSLC